MSALQADHDQISKYFGALFKYASDGGYISLRVFLDLEDGPPVKIRAVKLNGAGLSGIVDEAFVEAQRAASYFKPAVCCPPVAAFSSATQAREQDLVEAFALTVELDKNAAAAKATLEAVLGPATVVVASGGEWMNPATGDLEPKLHAHWRLTEPATGADHKKLKEARRFATALVGGDPTNIPMVHPIRCAGSWHRKGSPRLAQIIELNDGAEIDLDDAFEKLRQAAPEIPPNSANDGGSYQSSGTGYDDLITSILRGENLHSSLDRLAAKVVASGMNGGAAVLFLRGIMQGYPGPKDARWQSRYNDIWRDVATAEAKFSPRQGEPSASEGSFDSVLDPWERYVVPAFPLDVLPTVVRTYVEMQAKSSGGDISAVAMAVLTACSAALDQQFRIKMKQTGDWKVRPRMWTLLVGDPSSKKTPIVNSATGPLRDIEWLSISAWRKDHARWMLDKKAKEIDEGEEPPPPIRYLLNNITAEKLADLLSRQNRGVLMLADELSGFIGSMDKYSGGKGSGADRAMWLTAYNGGPFTVDRMSRGDTYVENLAVSFLGGVQPEKLEAMTDLTSDGLLQRFLPVMMRASSFPEEVEDDSPAEAYAELLQTLVMLRPSTLGASEAARTHFDGFQRQIFELERLEGLGGGFRSFLGKLTGVQGSLALLLHLIEDPREALYDRVSGDAAAAATRLLREFVIPHADALYRKTEGGNNMDPLRELASYVLTSGKQRFTASDFTTNVWKMRGLTSFEAANKVSTLVAGGWLEEVAGTVPIKAWTLKAGLREHFAERAESERLRKAEALKEIEKLRRSKAA